MSAREPRTPKWAGSLKSQKKSELQQICRALNLDFRADALKADLEQQIRNRFKEAPSLQRDARFAGLDHAKTEDSPSTNSTTSNSSARVTRTRSGSRARGDDDESTNEGESQEKSVSRRVSPRKSTSLPTTQPTPRKELVAAVQAAEKEVGQVFSKTATVVSQESNQAAQLVKRTTQQALESFNGFARCTGRSLVATIQAAQLTLSSPWNLCILAVVAELAFVLHSTVPIPKDLYVPPSTGKPVVRLPEPLAACLRLIFSRKFLRSLLEYTTLTVITPAAFAGLINVPSSRSGKKRFRLSDLKPSAFAYCATRLAIVVLMHSVFYPAYHYGWAYHQPVLPQPTFATLEPPFQANYKNIGLVGFESVQYVSTAFGLAIALHQLLTSLQ